MTRKHPIDWSKDLSPEEIEFYQELREKQQQAKEKFSSIPFILEQIHD